MINLVTKGFMYGWKMDDFFGYCFIIHVNFFLFPQWE